MNESRSEAGALCAAFSRKNYSRVHIIPDVSLSDAEPSGVKRTDGTRSAVAGGTAVTVKGTAADPLTWIVLGKPSIELLRASRRRRA